MASNRREQPPVFPRGASESLYSPEDVARRIHNFVVTPDGSLRSVVGPAEYAPLTYQGADANFGSFAPTKAYGVHHALVQGGTRSILLAHWNGGIYEHQGWRVGQGSTTNLGWTLLIGPASAAKYQYTPPEADDRAGFLTQFVSTPSGVVIIPQGGRSFFYDGEILAPLGYASRPGAPTGLGPTLEQTAANTWTPYGYLLDGRGQPRAFGYNRFGPVINNTVASASNNDSNPYGGVLQKCSRRCRVQWVDIWGNLSAPSPESDVVTFQREENVTRDRKGDQEEPVAALRKQIPWLNIDRGPERTIGRILGFTKDLENGGDARYYVASGDTAVNLSAFATIPDNQQVEWMDNVPDAWLQVPQVEVEPVPLFRLAAMAFGRLWIANWAGSPGVVRPSLPGRWGTFPVGEEIYPDPNAEVTGLVTVNQGLIVCTEQSAFLVEINDQGDGFRARTLSGRAGCVSPNSMGVLPSGEAMWLGREGWYVCDGVTVQLVSEPINNEVMRHINRGRWRRAVAAVDPRSGEYRCWVPLGASTNNNYCVVYRDGQWRSRDDVGAYATCVTQDHRTLTLVQGDVTLTSGADRLNLWVLDHAASGVDQPENHTAVLQSAWMRTPGKSRGSGHDVELWLRATSNTIQGTLRVTRDWRSHPVVEEHTDVSLVSDEDSNLFWGSTTLGGTYTQELRDRDPVANHWTARRPFWYRADVHLPDCEVWQFELRVTGDVDVAGLAYSETSARTKAGATKPAKR